MTAIARLASRNGRRQQLAAEVPGEKRRRTARDVDVLADEVAVDAGDEVIGIEVDVLDLRVELGGDVIAQPLGIEAEVEIDVGADAGAARLRHLLAGGRQEAVDEHVVRHLVRRPGELQHRGPEQRVEVDDVLADEVVLVDVGALQERREIDAALRQMRLEAREIADGGVEPDVEILARRVGNRNAEVRRIARDVPVGQPLAALGRAVAQPFERLVRHFGLQASRLLGPFLQERDAGGVGEPEEEVIRRLAHGRRAGDRRVRIPEVGRRVEGAAGFAGIAVLVLRPAFRAFALDVAVRQEDRLHRVVELLDRPGRDQRRHAVAQPAVDVLRQLDVLGRVGRMPVVEADVEAVEMLRARRGDLRDQRLRRDPLGVRLAA